MEFPQVQTGRVILCTIGGGGGGGGACLLKYWGRGGSLPLEILGGGGGSLPLEILGGGSLPLEILGGGSLPLEIFGGGGCSPLSPTLTPPTFFSYHKNSVSTAVNTLQLSYIIITTLFMAVCVN